MYGGSDHAKVKWKSGDEKMEKKVTPGKVNVYGANHIGGISGEIWRREKERDS